MQNKIEKIILLFKELDYYTSWVQLGLILKECIAGMTFELFRELEEEKYIYVFEDGTVIVVDRDNELEMLDTEEWESTLPNPDMIAVEDENIIEMVYDDVCSTLEEYTKHMNEIMKKIEEGGF